MINLLNVIESTYSETWTEPNSAMPLPVAVLSCLRERRYSLQKIKDRRYLLCRSLGNKMVSHTESNDHFNRTLTSFRQIHFVYCFCCQLGDDHFLTKRRLSSSCVLYHATTHETEIYVMRLRKESQNSLVTMAEFF